MKLLENYDGYRRALASMVYSIFDKKTGSGISEMNNYLKNYINQ